MTPPDLQKLIDASIDTDINSWIEEKHEEPQLEFETGEEEAITSADYNDF